MVQQASAASKKKEVIPPAFASITAADIIRAPVVVRSVPLDLLPLLKPFKRAGRLLLRVERMPQRAKMSAGRRNSDGSWSLASDELEGLEYLVPSNAPAEHEITIRVMTIDDGAPSTLKLIQYPIALEEMPAASDQDDTICRSTEAHDPVLRSQLGEMQSLFAVRESELAELRAAVEQAKSESAAELKKARTAWEQELHQRLAEATEQADQRQEHDHKRRDAKSQTTLKQAEERWRIQESVRTAAAHSEWQRQVAHERAEQIDKNTKLETLLAAETDKRRKLEAALAHAITQVKPAPANGENALELDRLRGELAGVKTALAEREQELARNHAEQDKERESWTAQVGQDIEAERKRWQVDTEQRIESERQTWQAQADQRAAAERERWQAEAGQQLEAERKRWQAETAKLIESERRALEPQTDQRVVAERERWQAETAQRIEKERQTWQAQSDQRLEGERKRLEAESLSALKRVEEAWKTGEAARSAAASAEWQQLSTHLLSEEKDKSAKLEISLAVEAEKCRKLDTALAHAMAQAKTASASSEKTPGLDPLRDELAGAKAALAVRELELVRSQAEQQQERDRWRREAQANLDAKAASWKAQEAVRLKAMAETHAQSDAALAEMTARCESAEYALAEVRSKAASGEPHADDGYIESLRSEIADLRKDLVKSETELGWARSALDQAQPLHLRRAAENLPIGISVPQQQEEEAEAPASAKRALVRDFLVVIAVVVPVILFYPWLAGYLPDGVRASLATVTGGLLSAGNEQPAVPHAAAPAPAPVAQRPTITITRSLNVRATPSVKGAVVVTLPRGASLIVLEQSGNWTHVEVPAKDASGKPQQGWIFSTYLGAKKESAKDSTEDGTNESAKESVPAAPLAVTTSKSATAPAAEPATVDHSPSSQPEGQVTPPASTPPASTPSEPSQQQ